MIFVVSFIRVISPIDGPFLSGGAEGMDAVQLAWNAIETHDEVMHVFFASPSPCADERERFREATVENEGYVKGGWRNQGEWEWRNIFIGCATNADDQKCD